MNAVTRLRGDDVAALFQHYDLGTVQQLSLAANGVENSNYFVSLASPTGQERQVVLTLLEQPSYAGRRPFVALLDSCVRAGLPVPKLHRNREGSAYERCLGKTALVSSRLPGQHVLNPTWPQITAIGRFLGRLHKATRPLTALLPHYPRDIRWLKDKLALIEAQTPYSHIQLLRRGVEASASLLQRQDVALLPRSGIHGDLFRDNALFNHNALTGVLDFHHASAGYCIYDLAVLANDWCTDTEGWLDPDRTLRLLRAYHSSRPLEAAELWWFPLFCCYAATAFCLSRNQARVLGSGRLKNPEELSRILERQLQSPFYLNERLINLDAG